MPSVQVATVGPETQLFPAPADAAALQDAAGPWASPASFDRRSFFLEEEGRGRMASATEPDPMDAASSSYYARSSPTDVRPAAAADDSQHHRAAADMVAPAMETDRVPCPRLCGATFSAGVGGMAGTYLKRKGWNWPHAWLAISFCLTDRFVYSVSQWWREAHVALVGEE